MTRLGAIIARRRAGAKIGRRFHKLALRFWNDTRGTTAIEYVLVAGLIFLAIVGATRIYADRVAAMYQYIGSNVAKSS